MIANDALRELPSVHELAQELSTVAPSFPRALVIATARYMLEEIRQEISRGAPCPPAPEILRQISAELQRLETPSLRPVINATGVVLHTNLGRAPLGIWQPHPGYCNLEYDVASGQRRSRNMHIEPLLKLLLKRSAIAVNNGAAATFLALQEFAAGYEVIVSRGELVEIGDGFRIPEILARSGAILKEVGTTNRTSIDDYRAAINERTRLLLRVHPSNFHINGFTGRPSRRELAELGRERGIIVYEDLGSGNLIDLQRFGISEPLVTESLDAGLNLVSFSCDKLLGGPQAGILAGDAELIQRLRRNPLFRALRLDKLLYQALASALRNIVLENWQAVPAICMIQMSADEIGTRARHLFPGASLISGESVIGGGSTPDQSIPTVLIVAARDHIESAARTLRFNDPPVIARISKGLLVLDLRTVFTEEQQQLRAAVLALPGNAGL